MAKIDIDELAIAVINELDAYREDVMEAVEKAVKETAKQTAAELERHRRKEMEIIKNMDVQTRCQAERQIQV